MQAIYRDDVNKRIGNEFRKEFEVQVNVHWDLVLSPSSSFATFPGYNKSLKLVSHRNLCISLITQSLKDIKKFQEWKQRPQSKTSKDKSFNQYE